VRRRATHMLNLALTLTYSNLTYPTQPVVNRL
jgi:hypothetical protein